MLITINDVKTRGYDLLKDGALIQGDFATKEDSANQFIEECCDMVWALIEKHKGFKWVEQFKLDMENQTNSIISYYKENMKKILLDQIVFIYENGDSNATALKDENKRVYSPKVIAKLYNLGILKM